MTLQLHTIRVRVTMANLEKIKTDLPEAVLTYRVLNSAKMSQDKEELALATVKSLTCGVVDRLNPSWPPSNKSENPGKVFIQDYPLLSTYRD